MTDVAWWQRGIIYQIYPRSFQDSDGDGIGDLKGIHQRLDYLMWLGIEAIWISPIYPSPMADFGYDITNYCAVDPIFGTLSGFDLLLNDAHARGLKVILDFVPNHSSDRHPWFAESRAVRDNPRRDWYIWRDPAPDGGPPNNWLSNFGGSAWEFDLGTGQYYYHAFLKEQPDLNWRNPAVQQAMFAALRFWLDRGVDGFRVDVLWHLMKDDQFRDDPQNPAWNPHQPNSDRLLQTYSADRPEIHDVVAAIRAELDRYPDRVLIGEIYLPLGRLAAYYGRELKGAQLPFNFQLLSIAWSAPAVAKAIQDYEAALPPGGWPNWVLGNHDRRRIASRVGPARARIAAMLLLTLRGTPTMYYGDEIGMEDVPIPPDAVQDPWEKNEPGLGLGRDPMRTPMPWDESDGAGFTEGHPWLPLNSDHASRNVRVLATEDGSILTLYRRLIQLRQRCPALREGVLTDVSTDGDVLVFQRQKSDDSLLIALNFGDAARSLNLSLGSAVTPLLSTCPDIPLPADSRELLLRPAEGVVIALSGKPS
jgi:alpha-glucosidase